MKIDVSDMIGKPFEEFGRGPHGYDCWGLCIEVGKRVGIVIPDYGDLTASDPTQVQNAFLIHCWEFKRVMKDPQPGDIIVFKRTTDCLHFGAIVDERYAVQAKHGIGVHRFEYRHPFFKTFIEGIYRHG